MAYIIENANILVGKELKVSSLLIRDDRIASLNPSLGRMKLMKMNANSFILTPPHIILDTNIPFEKPFSQLKEYYLNQFIKKGCTTFLTYVSIEHEYLLQAKLKKLKTHLLNCPIDFVIGVRIPLRLLTPSLLRKCKKEKLPVVFVEIEDPEELSGVPWGWVREAMFPYNSPLVPIFKQENDRRRKFAEQTWVEVVAREKIPSIKNEIIETVPISYSDLCKMGVLPLKSYIHQGGEVSYNLYLKGREIRKIEESELFHYHNHRLQITVHKGTVIRSGEDVYYRPGFGEHVRINTPAFFK